MTKTETIVNTLCDFIAYVDSFYNAETGIYPIKGMTNSMVIKGVQTYITQIGQAESLEWGVLIKSVDLLSKHWYSIKVIERED